MMYAWQRSDGSRGPLTELGGRFVFYLIYWKSDDREKALYRKNENVSPISNAGFSWRARNRKSRGFRAKTIFSFPPRRPRSIDRSRDHPHVFEGWGGNRWPVIERWFRWTEKKKSPKTIIEKLKKKKFPQEAGTVVITAGGTDGTRARSPCT